MFTEDLSSFLRDFGESVTLPSGTIQAIIDEIPKEMALYDRSFYDEKFYAAKVQGESITFLAKTSELTGLAVNNSVTIRGINYKVAQIAPDGTGFTVVEVSKHTV